MKPRRVRSFIFLTFAGTQASPSIARPRSVRRHRRRGQQRQALRFSTRAAYFQVVEKQRWCHERSRQSESRGAKRAESGSSKTRFLALHVVVNEDVVADAAEAAEHARVQANGARTSNHLFAPVCRIGFVDDERQTIASPGAAPEAREQFREVILVKEADGRIVHLSDDHTVRQFL